MQKHLDWATFMKLDNAMTVDFLSSLAASLAEHQQFPERTLELLRQTLSTRSSEWSQNDKSIVCALADEKNQILSALVYRYGVAGFSFNHTRFALRTLTADLLNRLAVWADVALKKGELVFNRPFFVKSETGIERRELFSQVLFSMSQLIVNAMADIRAALTEISTMRPSDILDITGELEKMDTSVALQMGFAGLDEMAAFTRGETRALSRLGISLRELSDGVTHIVSQLIPNCLPSDELLETTAYCELLSAEVQKFLGLTFPESKSHVVWEMRRQAICFSVYTVSQLVGNLSDKSARSIAPMESKDWRSLLSNDVTRRLTTELFASGADFSEARDASQKLLDYCLHHDTEPSQLIPAELKKIHPALTTKTLDLLLSLSSNDLSATPGGATSKIRITTGAKKIRKGLSNLAPFAAPLAAFALVAFTNSCGVKTGLKTDIDDLRPAIPYRELSPEEQSELSKKSSKSKTQPHSGQNLNPVIPQQKP